MFVKWKNMWNKKDGVMMLSSAASQSSPRMGEGYRYFIPFVKESILVAFATVVCIVFIFGTILLDVGESWGYNDIFAYYAWTDTWGFLWPVETTHYGFPEGTNMSAFYTMAYIPHTLASFLMSIIGINAVASMNIVFLLLLPISAVITYLTLRLVVKGGVIPGILSLVFIFVPYSIHRVIFGHWDLAILAGVSAGVFLAVAIGLGRIPQWVSRSNPNRVYYMILIVFMVIFTSFSNFYYAVFGLLALGASLLWLFMRRFPWREILISAVPVFAVVFLSLLAVLPVLFFSSQLGTDTSNLERPENHSIMFSGALAPLLIPIMAYQAVYETDHGFAEQTIAEVFSGGENVSSGQYGTIIITVCFLIFILGWFFGFRHRAKYSSVLNFFMFQFVFLLLWFIPLGLNYVFASLVTPQIRSWNRLLPYLMLFIILGAAVVWQNSSLSKKLGKILPISLLVAVFFFEQVLFWLSATTSTHMQGYINYTKEVKRYQGVINETILERCGILQLPQVYFSDNGNVEYSWKLPTYEPGIHAVLNKEKDFSYGSIFGTVSDPDLYDPSLEFILSPDKLQEKGFCGVHVDIRGYTKEEGEKILEALTNMYGKPSSVGYDEKWVFYDVRG